MTLLRRFKESNCGLLVFATLFGALDWEKCFSNCLQFISTAVDSPIVWENLSSYSDSCLFWYTVLFRVSMNRMRGVTLKTQSHAWKGHDLTTSILNGKWTAFLYLFSRLPTTQSTCHVHPFTKQWRCDGIWVSLPKDMSACRLEEPGTEPPNFWIVNSPLYLLSHSHPYSATHTHTPTHWQKVRFPAVNLLSCSHAVRQRAAPLIEFTHQWKDGVRTPFNMPPCSGRLTLDHWLTSEEPILG